MTPAQKKKGLKMDLNHIKRVMFAMVLGVMFLGGCTDPKCVPCVVCDRPSVYTKSCSNEGNVVGQGFVWINYGSMVSLCLLCKDAKSPKEKFVCFGEGPFDVFSE